MVVQIFTINCIAEKTPDGFFCPYSEKFPRKLPIEITNINLKRRNVKKRAKV